MPSSSIGAWEKVTSILLFLNINDVYDNFYGFFHVINTCEFVTTHVGFYASKDIRVGMPMKEILEPSVPPRIGSQIGVDTRFFHSCFSYVDTFHVVLMISYIL